jgi:hypothetical protein
MENQVIDHIAYAKHVAYQAGHNRSSIYMHSSNYLNNMG